MSSTAQRFDTFLSNLQLTEAQIRDAITKHRGVRKALHTAFYGDTTKSSDYFSEAAYEAELVEAYKASVVTFKESSVYSTSLLVGSYGKNTEIAPPSDIDILFKMPIHLYTKYDKDPYNGQSQLLQDVKNVLRKAYPSTDIRGDGQIVDVPFISYKVEVLPAFHSSGDQYLYPDAHNGGSWRVTNPKAEKLQISASNKRSEGNTIRLIKMIKAWKRYCAVPIKSLVIELRAVNFLQTYEYYNRSSMFYDWIIRDFFKELLKHTNGSCKIPGIEETIYYGDAWKTKAESAYSRAIKACEYESAEYGDSATLEWKKIFGSQFYFV